MPAAATPLPADLARVLLAWARTYRVPPDLRQPNTPDEGIAGLAPVLDVKREWVSRCLNRHQRRGGSIAAPSEPLAQTLCAMCAEDPVYGPEVRRIAEVDPLVAGWLKYGQRRVRDVRRLERGYAHRPTHPSRAEGFPPRVGAPALSNP